MAASLVKTTDATAPRRRTLVDLPPKLVGRIVEFLKSSTHLSDGSPANVATSSHENRERFAQRFQYCMCEHCDPEKPLSDKGDIAMFPLPVETDIQSFSSVSRHLRTTVLAQCQDNSVIRYYDDIAKSLTLGQPGAAHREFVQNLVLVFEQPVNIPPSEHLHDTNFLQSFPDTRSLLIDWRQVPEISATASEPKTWKWIEPLYSDKVERLDIRLSVSPDSVPFDKGVWQSIMRELRKTDFPELVALRVDLWLAKSRIAVELRPWGRALISLNQHFKTQSLRPKIVLGMFYPSKPSWDIHSARDGHKKDFLAPSNDEAFGAFVHASLGPIATACDLDLLTHRAKATSFKETSIPQYLPFIFAAIRNFRSDITYRWPSGKGDAVPTRFCPTDAAKTFSWLLAKFTPDPVSAVIYDLDLLLAPRPFAARSWNYDRDRGYPTDPGRSQYYGSGLWDAFY